MMRPSINILFAIISVTAIVAHLVLRYGLNSAGAEWPLLFVMATCGLPMVWQLLRKLLRRDFGSDLLAGVSIVTSVILGEYLAGSIVVLMLSGGQVLEHYAVAKASSVLHALAKRMPFTAALRRGDKVSTVQLDQVSVGDELIVNPHEICPVDGTVVEGHGVMDESYLTGEPYRMSKTPGSDVYSGAINGEAVLAIRATKRAVDSRYAKIMQVMQETEQSKPKMRRIGDQLGAAYTPFAIALALTAWALSGDAHRFLAVLVVATPCPLLIAIPVAIIGAISLAARRGIIIRNPIILEQLSTCRTVIFDKTGTLTYGEPKLTEIHPSEGFTKEEIVTLAASLEQYSKHPLAQAILREAKGLNLNLKRASEISEPPGRGLFGVIESHKVEITSRKDLIRREIVTIDGVPPMKSGLECVVAVDGKYAGLFRFHDAPRKDSKAFIGHLSSKHGFQKIMLVSGDRQSEVEYLAEQVGIQEIHAGQSPEQKVEIVAAESQKAKTLFVGDGINDAPALMRANVGIAFGSQSDVTTEAASAVILESSLRRVDELFHISERMRSIALQSAIGGMALSIIGMALAAVGTLPPVAGALFQEAIDLIAVLNALRAAIVPRTLVDFE